MTQIQVPDHVAKSIEADLKKQNKNEHAMTRDVISKAAHAIHPRRRSRNTLLAFTTTTNKSSKSAAELIGRTTQKHRKCSLNVHPKW